MTQRPSIAPSPYQGPKARLFLAKDAPGLLVETHQHLYCEFDMVIEGGGFFHCGKSVLEAKPGDIFYIARGVRHRRESSPLHPLRLCNADIPERLLRKASKSFKPWPLLHRWRGAGVPKEAREAFKRLLRKTPRKSGVPLELSGSFQRTVCRELAAALDFQSALLGRKAPFLIKLAKRVAARPERRFPLDAEAKKAGVSRFHLCRSFKQAFGIGLVEYRDLARAELALKALRRGGESVEELGLRLGYSSKTHFINAFKRAAGATPGKFRRGGNA